MKTDRTILSVMDVISNSVELKINYKIQSNTNSSDYR